MIVTPADEEAARAEVRRTVVPIILVVFVCLSWALWDEPIGMHGPTLGQALLMIGGIMIGGFALILALLGGNWLSRRGQPKTDWAGRPADDLK